MSKPLNLASTRVAAGKRNYFIDVQQGENSRYLKISETAPAGDGKYNRNQIIIWEDNLPQVLAAIESMRQHLQQPA